MSIRRTASIVVGSASLYPITAVYLVAVVLLWCTMSGLLRIAVAVIILGLVTVCAVSWSAYREARIVHTLIEGQRAELLEHIGALREALAGAGVSIPAAGRREQEARDDVRKVPADAWQPHRG